MNKKPKYQKLDLSNSTAEIQEMINEQGRLYNAIVIKTNPDDAKPFSLGIKRARLVLMHLDKIRHFLQEYGK